MLLYGLCLCSCMSLAKGLNQICENPIKKSHLENWKAFLCLSFSLLAFGLPCPAAQPRLLPSSARAQPNISWRPSPGRFPFPLTHARSPAAAQLRGPLPWHQLAGAGPASRNSSAAPSPRPVPLTGGSHLSAPSYSVARPRDGPCRRRRFRHGVRRTHEPRLLAR